MSNPQFTSEEDFENSDDSKTDGVAIDKKHASQTVVIKPSPFNPFKNKPDFTEGEREKFDGKMIMGSEREASPSERVSSTEPSASQIISSNNGVISGKNLDKINNLVQKEIALGRVGVTREKAYKVIAAALDAHRWMDVMDKQGNIKQEWVPDLDKQRWGAEMAIKMFGDMIERKEIEHDLGDKTIDRLRALSVAELKSRAADLLLGKRVGAIQDAEMIK